MLKKIYFKFGSSPGQTPLEFTPGSMTVFVGSNNSGKSLTLREIEAFMEEGQQSKYKIISNCDLELPKDREYIEGLIMSRCDEERSRSNSLGKITINHSKLHSNGNNKTTSGVDINSLIQRIINNQLDGSVYNYFISLLTVRLDGRTRFSLTEPRPSDDLQKAYSSDDLHKIFSDNHLIALFRNNIANLNEL